LAENTSEQSCAGSPKPSISPLVLGRAGLEYKFRLLEWNGLKGLIGEHLARSFIRNKLSLKLIKEEGWDHVLFSGNDYKKHSWTWNTKLFKFDNFREDFIVHGFCANVKLLSKYAMAAGILMQNHCTPDGFLLKMRETGKTIALKQSDFFPRTKLKARRHKKRLVLPIVEGDLEVVEIKCGRSAKLMSKQREAYNNLMAKGIPLRMIKVKIV